MPPMIQRKDLSAISRALESQARTSGSSLRLTNRCIAGDSFRWSKPLNRNLRLVTKPMSMEEEMAVVKRTGFTPFLATKFVRAR